MAQIVRLTLRGGLEPSDWLNIKAQMEKSDLDWEAQNETDDPQTILVFADKFTEAQLTTIKKIPEVEKVERVLLIYGFDYIGPFAGHVDAKDIIVKPNEEKSGMKNIFFRLAWLNKKTPLYQVATVPEDDDEFFLILSEDKGITYQNASLWTATKRMINPKRLMYRARWSFGPDEDIR